MEFNKIVYDTSLDLFLRITSGHTSWQINIPPFADCDKPTLLGSAVYNYYVNNVCCWLYSGSSIEVVITNRVIKVNIYLKSSGNG